MRQRRMRSSIRPQKANRAATGRRPPLRVILSFFLMICIGLYGCSTMQIPDYPKTSVTEIGNATTKKDLCIAVRAITDKNDLEHYFGTDLSELRVVPVYVVAENKNMSISFLLSKDRMALKHREAKGSTNRGEYTVTGDSTGGAVATGAGAAALVLAPVLALPLLFAGGKAISDATIVKQNMASKSLQTRTVSPGRSIDGFVYFTLPDPKTSLADWSVSLEVKELGSDLTHNFEFGLK
jgi:hypothetical protein